VPFDKGTGQPARLHPDGSFAEAPRVRDGDTQMAGFGANSTGSGAGSARYRLS
jgi:hypothetical protein